MAKFKEKNLILNTNEKIYLGDNNNTYITFDGTNFLIFGPINFGNSIISGTGDFYAGSIYATDQLQSKNFHGIGSSNEEGFMVLGGSESVSPSYIEIFDGGSGKPGYITFYSSGGIPYYLSISDNGGVYIDDSIPSGSGKANLLFSDTAVVVHGDIIADKLSTGEAKFSGDILFGPNVVSGTGDIYCNKIFTNTTVTDKRSGRVDCLVDFDYVDIVFSPSFYGVNYSIIVSLEKKTGMPSQYTTLINSITTSGCRVNFSGNIDDIDYKLHYIAIYD